MNCYKHPDRMSINRCNDCGQYVCSECEVIIKGVPYCKNCVSKMAANNEYGGTPKNAKPYYGHIPHEYHLHKGHRPKSDVNAFFLFVLSAVPGLNYMYMGLMKRGMFFMSLFFLLWFAMACLNAPAFAFLIFMEMCYSFFDGFQIRRRILNGETVHDSIDSYMDFIKTNKAMLTVGTILIIALNLLSNFSRSLNHMGVGFGRGFFNTNGVGLIIVIIGIVIIYKSFKKPNRHDDDVQ